MSLRFQANDLPQWRRSPTFDQDRRFVGSWLYFRRITKPEAFEIVFLSGEERPDAEAKYAELTLGQVLNQAVPQSHLDRLERTLLLLSRKFTYGQGINLDQMLDPVYYGVRDMNEAGTIMEDLREKRWILARSHGGRQNITAAGYEKLDELTRTHPAVSNKVFLASWLDPLARDAMVAGQRAMRDMGFEVRWLGDDPPPNGEDITNEIIANIRSATFVVSDMTGERPSVYFEAGFAYALKKEVIYTIMSADYAERVGVEALKMHFDTNHYPHLKYNSPEDLASQLPHWIRARGFA